MADQPVKRFGGPDEPYDGVSAVGWHVTMRDHAGELESIGGGPFASWADAVAALAKMMRGERP